MCKRDLLHRAKTYQSICVPLHEYGGNLLFNAGDIMLRHSIFLVSICCGDRIDWCVRKSCMTIEVEVRCFVLRYGAASRTYSFRSFSDIVLLLSIYTMLKIQIHEILRDHR
jgi:hypothetical protein